MSLSCGPARLVELGESAAMFEAPQHPYTVQLLASMPDVEATAPRFPETMK